MEIYLARVCERNDGTLYVERTQTSTTAKVSFVAISHVWGDPSTIQTSNINGVGPVELSPIKKDLLDILRRSDVCGADWFWLDLFCIDQSPNSPISISAQLMSIPAIYKASRIVVVLIESPVCCSWASQAEGIVEEGVRDDSAFRVEEESHARKCPNMALMDPWFDRLWTRQEGLYAMDLSFVFLNEVECTRYTTLPTPDERYTAERHAVARRGAVETFVTDKFAYHGVSCTNSEVKTRGYYDLLYKRRLDIARYGGQAGPKGGYMPIMEAWRSGRETAKARDYVLALFPDIKGYRVPSNPRPLSFSQLFVDACEQFSSPNHGLRILSKVPRGMVTTKASGSTLPWVLGTPANITEACDSIVMVSDTGVSEMQPTASCQQVRLNKLQIRNGEEMERLIKGCEAKADLVRHCVLAPPSGPLIGSDKGLEGTDTTLYRFFAFEFGSAATRQYHSDWSPNNALDDIGPAAHLVRRHEIPKGFRREGDVFEQELKIFLVALLCGTTLRCAAEIAKHVSVVEAVVEDDPETLGILGLVNRSILKSMGRLELTLGSNGHDKFQGCHIFVGPKSPDASRVVVGRTVILKG